MPDYRVYPVDKNDKFVAVAYIVTCDTDQEAIEKACPVVCRFRPIADSHSGALRTAIR